MSHMVKTQLLIGLLFASLLIAGCAGSEPTTSTGYKLQAAKQLLKGEYPTAIASFDKAIELEPNRIKVLEIYNLRASAKSLNGDHAGAIADYSKTIELAGNPAKNGDGWADVIDAYDGLATEKICTSDYVGAIAAETKSYGLLNNPADYIVLAYAKIYQGDDTGANEYISKYAAESSGKQMLDLASLKAKATAENKCKVNSLIFSSVAK